MKVLGFENEERTLAWLRNYFGDVKVKDTADKKYETNILAARRGDASIVVRVVDKNNLPVRGIAVAFYWPDAPAHPDGGWYGKCEIGHTNDDGCVGFGYGTGAYYYPPAGGPHAVWVYGTDVSQMVDGLGMLGGTNHEHVNVEFKEVLPATPEPEKHKLTMSIGGNCSGDIRVEPSKLLYEDSEVVKLTAITGEGCVFTGWTGDLSGTTNPTSLVMNEDKSVNGIFTQEIIPEPPIDPEYDMKAIAESIGLMGSHMKRAARWLDKAGAEAISLAVDLYPGE